MLAIDLEKQLGEFRVGAKFETRDGVTALFGPSGSGKTSIVNMVAGLLTPDRGRVMCNGTLLSREQYLVDIERHGDVDARLREPGRMTREDIATWTEAIKDK